MLPRTPLHWLSSAEVGAKFGAEQYLGVFFLTVKVNADIWIFLEPAIQDNTIFVENWAIVM